jgi:hypothetical protein
MEVALKSFKDAQRAGGIPCYVRLGDEVRYSICKFPLAYILAMQSPKTVCVVDMVDMMSENVPSLLCQLE